jgi:hypothetical protein
MRQPVKAAKSVFFFMVASGRSSPAKNGLSLKKVDS